jgi:hypothetical protein
MLTIVILNINEKGNLEHLMITMSGYNKATHPTVLRTYMALYKSHTLEILQKLMSM